MMAHYDMEYMGEMQVQRNREEDAISTLQGGEAMLGLFFVDITWRTATHLAGRGQKSPSANRNTKC